MDLSLYSTASGGYDSMTAKEKELAGLFGKILNVDPLVLSSKSDFFMHGGDSLSLILLSSESASIGLNLSSKDVLTLRTIRKMVAKACSAQGHTIVVLKDIVLR